MRKYGLAVGRVVIGEDVMLKVRFLVFLLSLVSLHMATGASAQSLLVDDLLANSVYEFDASGNLVGGLVPFGDMDETNGNVENPRAIAFDSSGNIYVGGQGAGGRLVNKFNEFGDHQSIFVDVGTPQFGLVFDSDDNLYLLAGGSSPSLRKYDDAGPDAMKHDLSFDGRRAAEANFTNQYFVSVAIN